MYEADLSRQTRPSLLVDQLNAFAGECRQFFVNVIDLQTDVMDALPAGLELVILGLRKTFEVGSFRAQRVNEALKRIRRAKKGIRLPTGKFSKKAYDRLCREFEDFAKDCKSAEREIV